MSHSSDSDSSAASPAQRFATFSLAGQSCAVALEQLAAVVAPTQLVDLPHSASWLLGVTAWRGRAVSVVDVAQLLELRLESTPASQKWLIIEWRQQWLALQVDSVGAIITAQHSQPLSQSSALSALATDSVVDSQGSSFTALSVDRLYDHFDRRSPFLSRAVTGQGEAATQ